MKKDILFITFLFLLINITAQEGKVNKVLRDIRSELVTGKTVKTDEEILFMSGNESYTLAGIKTWYNDTLKDIRSRAVTITARMGLKTKEPAFRQEAVKMLVQACDDKDIALAGSAINYLTHFNRRDFVKETRDSVGALLKKQLPQFEKLIRLAGFLELKDQQPFLENLLNNKSLSTKLQWSIHLALARMGNTNSANVCLQLAKGSPVDDNIVYYVLPDLVYTRQKQVYNYLLEILNSDKKSCTSPNPNYAGHILCGYRVMEALAGVVKDFPIKTSKSGDIITDDYDKALQTTREWFKTHKDYELDMEVY
jgi:hypothetical protein